MSPKMLRAIEIIKNKGGEVRMYPGGYWLEPGLEFPLDDVGCAVMDHGSEYIKTATIYALIRRQLLDVIGEKKAKHNGNYYPSIVRLRKEK